ncbi:MAG: endonuclease III domain-containing protein [Promethearchaeota archaeon]
MSQENKYLIVREKILEWYNRNKNDYPWRKTKNLFRILITEILLQKTIASNVANIYKTFFNKYKDFSEISNVNINDLQADIKSLGLSNKRAKILKDLSEMIVNEYKGKIPEKPENLKRVNGIANYVSNAFFCFGMGKRTLFIDVNIRRFITRVFKSSNLKIKDKIIEGELNKLLPESDCKYLYWAILDFGNKICTKNNPKCDNCPIFDFCNLNS